MLTTKTNNNFFNPNFISLAFLGFNSGLAFILLNSTIIIALSYSDFPKKYLPLILFTSFPYFLKILWAPLMDYYSIPKLNNIFGHRRSWLLITQISLFLVSTLIAFQSTKPLLLFIILVLCVFLAASQDISLDAYRLEKLASNELAVGSTFSMTGFRVGTLLGGTIPLYLLKSYSWNTTFLITSLLLLIGPITTLMVEEPTGIKRNTSVTLPSGMEHLKAVANNLIDFFKRSNCLLIIFFIFFYKIGDTIPNAMKGPLLHSLAFTPIETANISQAYGNSLMLVGGFLGGILANRLGIFRAILFGSIVQLLSLLMYIWLTIVGHNIQILIITTTVHSICCGLAATILVIYVSSLCKKGAAASQFSLIWSFSSLSRTILSSLSGLCANYTNWTIFFMGATLLGLPVFLIIKKLIPSFNNLNSIEET